MNRRHFTKIADVFSDLYRDDTLDKATLDATVAALIPVFEWANPLFAADTFTARIHSTPVK